VAPQGFGFSASRRKYCTDDRSIDHALTRGLPRIDHDDGQVPTSVLFILVRISSTPSLITVGRMNRISSVRARDIF
jgi:hypothetical protein